MVSMLEKEIAVVDKRRVSMASQDIVIYTRTHMLLLSRPAQRCKGSM